MKPLAAALLLLSCDTCLAQAGSTLTPGWSSLSAVRQRIQVERKSGGILAGFIQSVERDAHSESPENPAAAEPFTDWPPLSLPAGIGVLTGACIRHYP